MSAIHDVAFHRAQPQLQLAVLVLQLHDDRVEELDLKVTTCKRALETKNNIDKYSILLDSLQIPSLASTAQL